MYLIEKRKDSYTRKPFTAIDFTIRDPEVSYTPKRQTMLARRMQLEQERKR
jgi:hypothetical protein